LLSLRTAFVLQLETTIGAAAGFLLYLANRPLSLVVLGALGAFAAALKFFDDISG